MWVDEEGVLDVSPDNPAWGLFYTSDDDEEGYGVLAHYDGHTDSGEGPPPEITEELGDYDGEDVEGWMEAAITKMEDNPDALDDYDYALAVAYSEVYGRDVVIVYFFAESDKDTDYDVGSWDPNEYFLNPYAFVFLDAETALILGWSW
jgi:hypothetical protein